MVVAHKFLSAIVIHTLESVVFQLEEIEINQFAWSQNIQGVYQLVQSHQAPHSYIVVRELVGITGISLNGRIERPSARDVI